MLAVASVFGSSREMYLPAMAALASSFSPARHEWAPKLGPRPIGRVREELEKHSTTNYTGRQSTAQHSMAQLSMPCIQPVLTNLMHVYHRPLSGSYSISLPMGSVLLRTGRVPGRVGGTKASHFSMASTPAKSSSTMWWLTPLAAMTCAHQLYYRLTKFGTHRKYLRACSDPSKMMLACSNNITQCMMHLWPCITHRCRLKSRLAVAASFHKPRQHRTNRLQWRV